MVFYHMVSTATRASVALSAPRHPLPRVLHNHKTWPTSPLAHLILRTSDAARFLLAKREQPCRHGAFTKEREAGERSLGGEGLLPDRIDESMPFIDSGYVDESQGDVMEELGKMGENFGKMFGGGDKKK